MGEFIHSKVIFIMTVCVLFGFLWIGVSVMGMIGKIEAGYAFPRAYYRSINRAELVVVS
jgi:hypothetical protein